MLVRSWAKALQIKIYNFGMSTSQADLPRTVKVIIYAECYSDDQGESLFEHQYIQCIMVLYQFLHRGTMRNASHRFHRVQIRSYVVPNGPQVVSL